MRRAAVIRIIPLSGNPEVSDLRARRGFGRKCLLAWRLIERGVRFVQAYCDDEWDSHNGVKDHHAKLMAETDQPVAALLTEAAGSSGTDAGSLGW